MAELEDDVPSPRGGDEQLEDSGGEGGNALKALFEDDAEDSDGDEDYEQKQQEEEDDDLEDEEGDGAGPASHERGEPDLPAGIVEPTAVDRKAGLAALLARKKQGGEGDDGGKKKKRKRDKEGKEKGEKRSKKKDKEGKRSKKDKEEGGRRRSSRQRGELASGGGEGEGQGEPGGRPKRAGSVDSREVNEEDADRNFIDDDGVKPDDRYLEADAEPRGEEAEEVDEIEAEREMSEAEDGDVLFGRKRKKGRKESEEQMSMVVDNMLAKMEASAECDMEAHQQGKPAIDKLKLLAEVAIFLANRKYHELFMQSGGLGVLKAWLEPYSDGSLVNVKVRHTILKACKDLPIDTSREDVKSNLKKSQLGTLIMFHAKCPDETPVNKALARELVQAWSRPIFYDPEAEADKRRQKEEQLKRARVVSMETQRQQDEKLAQIKKEAPNKPGQAGYRWHAMIPQASKLDYVTQPERNEALAHMATVKADMAKEKDQRFNKKMRELQRKQKATGARAAKPSVEGRNIVLMH